MAHETMKEAAKRLALLAAHVSGRIAEDGRVLGVQGLGMDLSACRLIIDRLEAELRGSPLNTGDRVQTRRPSGIGLGTVKRVYLEASTWRALVEWDSGGSNEAPADDFALLSDRDGNVAIDL